MSRATKNKTVSNSALFVCTILDLIEPDELSLNKVYAIGPRVDKFLYELDRQVRKKMADEFYKLDISSADLQSIALAAEKHVNKLRPKCTYRSMRKALTANEVDGWITKKDYDDWATKTTTIFYVCGLLHRLQCVASYQANLLTLVEHEEEANKIENVMLNTLKSAIAKGPNVW